MQFINGLHFNNLRGDIYGGLTAAVVALPLALAMGVASGAGPVAGIYGAIFVGFFAALFGGTPAQVSGPTGPMTVVMALVFTQYTAMFPESPEVGATIAFTVVMMGGLFQVLFGIFRVGRFIELVPHPVVSGFMSGIGVIIILIELAPLAGHLLISKPLDAMRNLDVVFNQPNAMSLTLGMVSILIVFGVPKFLPKVNRMLPSPLLALLVGTVGYLLFIPDNSGVRVLGEIPTGLPTPMTPVITLDLFPGMVASALMLAALGSIDSLLTSLVADNVTRTFHKSDRELIGQGIGNTVAGLFGGLPGAGATMRTVVNVKSGGQTPISGSLHALLLLAVVLGAGSLASNIPEAVLAGILIKVGVDIIDWEYLAKLRHAPKVGIILMLTVLLMTVFIDLIVAVSTGMVMASLIFLQRMTTLQLDSMTITDTLDDELEMEAEEKQILSSANQRIVLFHMGGPVSFGAAKGMVRMMSRYKDYDVLILDMTEVPVIDFTATRALDTIIEDALGMGCEVMLVGARPNVTKSLKKQKVMDRIHSNFVFVKRIGALRAAAEYIARGKTIDHPIEH